MKEYNFFMVVSQMFSCLYKNKKNPDVTIIYKK